MDSPAPIHFRYRRLVEFADTDLAGIMHFANYFRFVESAEHAFFRSLGFSIHSSEGSRHDGWPRIEVTCKYHRPARFQETLEVRLHVTELRTTSLTYAFAIHSADAPGEPLVATGTFGIIHVELDTATREIRKTPIPAPLRAKLEAAMATTLKNP
ncbi:MAG: acyl-CoA thioesterase [Opitutaceae bacterium]|nr:acyl-CoA thioesterase [Opitutaceae bacterium]